MFEFMNKKASILILLLISTIFISSCINFEQISSLKIDGSGESYIHLWTKIDNAQDSLMFEATGLFNEENIRAKFSFNFIKISSIEVYRIAQDSTLHSKVKFTFSNIDSLNKLNFFNGNKFSFITDDEGDITFKHTLDASGTPYNFENENCHFTYTYYLPGKILEHNASSKSNNKLVWNLNSNDLVKSNTFMARFTPYKLKETPIWVYYSSLFIFLVVILYLFKRRRP